MEKEYAFLVTHTNTTRSKALGTKANNNLPPHNSARKLRRSAGATMNTED